EAVELDTLLGYFYRLPRLPKLAGPHVLREALVNGVHDGLFGLASGSTWDASDAVLRLRESVDPSEIQFQPGTWLVRAGAIRELIVVRGVEASSAPVRTEMPQPETSAVEHFATEHRARSEEAASQGPGTGPIPRLTIRIREVPGSKVRDV